MAKFEIEVTFNKGEGKWYAETIGLAIGAEESEVCGDGAEFPHQAVANLVGEIEHAMMRFAEFTTFPETLE